MDTKSKIVHINLSDTGGGGSLAALRLHTAMQNAGIDSTYMVFKRNILDRKDIIEIKPNKIVWFSRALAERIVNRIKRPFIGKINTKRGSFAFMNGYEDALKHKELLNCDIIYLHNIYGKCFSYRALKKIFALHKKTYWFLHDNIAFTGGCLHPFECEKYRLKCCKCQFWEGRLFFDCAEYEFNRKNKIIKKADDLAFIAPSFWMLENVKKSAIAKDKKHYRIPNLINPKIYKVIDKNAARKLLSIDNDKKILGFGAGNALTNPYKGWEYMKKALNILADKNKDNENTEILIFGSNYQKEVADSLPFKTHFLGFLSDEYSMVMMYNAIDVLVVPSLAENFPQTILESLACNVPVVAFDTGGISDMVNDKTGYLAKYKDCDDLANGMNFVLSQTEKKETRQFVEIYFAESIVRRHIEMWMR